MAIHRLRPVIHHHNPVLGALVIGMGDMDIPEGGILVGVTPEEVDMETLEVDIVQVHHMVDMATPVGLCMVPIVDMGKWTAREFP